MKKFIVENLSWGILQNLFITYILPPATAILVIWLGYLEKQPLMYIVVGAILAFAGMATGLLNFETWRYRRQVANKFNFQSVRFGRNIEGEGFVLGVQFQSTALFPIEFRIENLVTIFDTTVPSKNRDNDGSYEVPPEGVGYCFNHAIIIPDPISRTVEGKIEYTILYGRKGTVLKNKLSGKKLLHVKFDDAGNPVSTIPFNDDL